jgi:anti-anti-sigma factor
MNVVEVKSKVLDDAVIIYPGEYLNKLHGEIIEHRCREFLKGGIRRLVINFEETELINSIGISILLGVIETVKAANGTLLLTNLNESNHELFEMLGLLSHFSIEETEQGAIESIHPAVY